MNVSHYTFIVRFLHVQIFEIVVVTTVGLCKFQLRKCRILILPAVAL